MISISLSLSFDIQQRIKIVDAANICRRAPRTLSFVPSNLDGVHVHVHVHAIVVADVVPSTAMYHAFRRRRSFHCVELCGTTVLLAVAPVPATAVSVALFS